MATAGKTRQRTSGSGLGSGMEVTVASASGWDKGLGSAAAFAPELCSPAAADCSAAAVGREAAQPVIELRDRSAHGVGAQMTLRGRSGVILPEFICTTVSATAFIDNYIIMAWALRCSLMTHAALVLHPGDTKRHKWGEIPY